MSVISTGRSWKKNCMTSTMNNRSYCCCHQSLVFGTAVGSAQLFWPSSFSSSCLSLDSHQPLWAWTHDEETFGGPGNSICAPATAAPTSPNSRRYRKLAAVPPDSCCGRGSRWQHAAVHWHPIFSPSRLSGMQTVSSSWPLKHWVMI